MAMLLSVVPVPFIASSIRPFDDQSLTIQTHHILASCRQHTHPHTCVHQPMRNLPFHPSYYSSILLYKYVRHSKNKPLHISSYLTRAMDIIVEETSIINTLVSPHKPTFSMFLATLIHAFISGSIRPCLNTLSLLILTFAMLLIFEPLSIISRSILMGVDPVAMSLVILPFALINVSIRMDQFALAICLVIFPVALVA